MRAGTRHSPVRFSLDQLALTVSGRSSRVAGAVAGAACQGSVAPGRSATIGSSSA